MKAILVIEVDDINRFHADVYKEDDKGNGELIMSYRSLKPMPQKKIHIPKLNIWEITEEDKEIMIENRGYNKCIEEILGEQNENN